MTRQQLIAHLDLCVPPVAEWFDRNEPARYENYARARLYLLLGCRFEFYPLAMNGVLHRLVIWHPTFSSLEWAEESPAETFYLKS